MDKPNNIVCKETKYIAANILILSAIMQVVFIVIGKWNITVFTGNLLTAAAMIANFYFMGVGVSKAVEKDEADAKKLIKASQSFRTLGIFVVVVLAVVLPWFDTVSAIIPIFFTRIAVALRPMWERLGGKGGKRNDGVQ